MFTKYYCIRLDKFKENYYQILLKIFFIADENTQNFHIEIVVENISDPKYILNQNSLKIKIMM
jgi:hypothetical protein